jgi:hypothetical protein
MTIFCSSKKGAFDKRDWFRQQMNRYKKETQENAHKVSNQFTAVYQFSVVYVYIWAMYDTDINQGYA